MNFKRIIIAGGTGFIGRALAADFSAQDFEVVVLTRAPRACTGNVHEVKWDGKNVGEWVQNLDGAEAVINLTGKNINCPHTPENLQAIIASRVDSVNVIAAALQPIKIPPRVWVQAGAIGFYGERGFFFRERVIDVSRNTREVASHSVFLKSGRWHEL